MKKELKNNIGIIIFFVKILYICTFKFNNNNIMSNKKYFLLAFVVALVTLSNKSAFSQTESTSGSSSVYRGAGYDVLDTSLIPERRMEQQRDFLTNQYDFPSKPRNQWEIGVSFGSFSVSGDVRSKNLFTAKNPGQTMGFGLHLRKAWGYIISTRLQYLHGTASIRKRKYYIIAFDEKGGVSTHFVDESAILSAEAELEQHLLYLKECILLDRWAENYDFYCQLRMISLSLLLLYLIQRKNLR